MRNRTKKARTTIATPTSALSTPTGERESLSQKMTAKRNQRQATRRLNRTAINSDHAETNDVEAEFGVCIGCMFAE